MTSDALTRVLALSRRVATQQGADLYNKPIGSIIGPDADRPVPGPAAPATSKTNAPKDAPGRTTGAPDRVGEKLGGASSRPMTIERIRSLQRQVRIAMKADNSAGVRAAKRALSEAVTEFTKTRSADEVSRLLTAGTK